MVPGKFNVLIGGQAGSEAKGKAGAFLVSKFEPDVICMAASPNAGHTAYIPDNPSKGPSGQTSETKQVTYHLPVSALASAKKAPVLLGPSSIINISKFLQEIEDTGIDPDRITIHPRAMVITRQLLDKERDGQLSDIGSTLQGVGAARMSKMLRDGSVTIAADDPALDRFIGDTVVRINKALGLGRTVFCEATQGFDLDLEHGIHHRYCTSKMINTAMTMAEAGVAPRWVGSVYGVIRTLPIRVNNRTGTSGPYTGSVELTWEEVQKNCAAPEPLDELTTTTKLPRRVFTFSWERFDHFCRVCRPTAIVLQFANYADWSNSDARTYSELTHRTRTFMDELERIAGCPVSYIGTGPGHTEMIDRSSMVGG